MNYFVKRDLAISLLRRLYREDELVAEYEVNENLNDSSASIFTNQLIFYSPIYGTVGEKALPDQTPRPMQLSIASKQQRAFRS